MQCTLPDKGGAVSCGQATSQSSMASCQAPRCEGSTGADSSLKAIGLFHLDLVLLVVPRLPYALPQRWPMSLLNGGFKTL